MSVTVKNIAKPPRMLVYHLHRMAATQGYKGYRVTVVGPELNPKTGIHQMKERHVNTPPSITLCAGQTLDKVPNIVGSSPEIQRAAQRGEVSIVWHDDEPAPTKKKSKRPSNKPAAGKE